MLALRRPAAPFTHMQAKLQGLEPEAMYQVTASEGGLNLQAPGAELRQHGVSIQIPDQPGSQVLLYRRVG